MQTQEIVKNMFEYGVVAVNTQQPFLLASGKTAPVYFDHRRLFSLPQLREAALQVWANSLQTAFPQLFSLPKNQVVVVGTATAGIAPAFGLAEILGSRFVYVRSQSKLHGTGRMVEGVWQEGDLCLVVDDMVTTGKSVLDAVFSLRQHQGVVIGASSFTSHPFSATAARFQDAAVSFCSVIKSDEVFRLAAQLGLVSAGDLSIVLDWFAAQG